MPDEQQVAARVVQFEQTLPLSGSPEVALAIARDAFSARGFRLASNVSRSFEVTGPGLHSSKQDPLLGLSWARVSTVGGSLRLEAELEGVARLRRVLLWLLGGLEALFVVALGVAWLLVPALREMPVLWVVVVAPLAPWLFFLPFLAGLIRKNTMIAAETLLRNVVSETERRSEEDNGG